MPTSLREIGMAPGLRQHALARIDQQHREVGGRRAGHHVAGILLMAGRVGDDELASRAREEAIGDVDRDALLALRREPVDEQREIDLRPLRAVTLAVAFERVELVVEDLLALVEQPPDQGGLAVVDTAAGDEPQQLLVLPAARARPGRRGGSGLLRIRAAGTLEISLLLLFLHRSAAGVLSITRPCRSLVLVSSISATISSIVPPRFRPRPTADSNRGFGSGPCASPESRRPSGIGRHRPSGGARRAPPWAARLRSTAGRSRSLRA